MTIWSACDVLTILAVNFVLDTVFITSFRHFAALPHRSQISWVTAGLQPTFWTPKCRYKLRKRSIHGMFTVVLKACPLVRLGLPAEPIDSLSSVHFTSVRHNFGPNLITLTFKPPPIIAAIALPGGPFAQLVAIPFFLILFFFPIKK